MQTHEKRFRLDITQYSAWGDIWHTVCPDQRTQQQRPRIASWGHREEPAAQNYQTPRRRRGAINWEREKRDDYICVNQPEADCASWWKNFSSLGVMASRQRWRRTTKHSLNSAQLCRLDGGHQGQASEGSFKWSRPGFMSKATGGRWFTWDLLPASPLRLCAPLPSAVSGAGHSAAPVGGPMFPTVPLSLFSSGSPASVSDGGSFSCAACWSAPSPRGPPLERASRYHNHKPQPVFMIQELVNRLH